jgi:hypothetical protein
MRVIYDHPPFHKGEKIWVLARDLEEGTFDLWYKGPLHPDSGPGDINLWIDGKHCDRPSPECWLSAGEKTSQEFWVQSRKKDGTNGWTNQPDHFEEYGRRF